MLRRIETGFAGRKVASAHGLIAPILACAVAACVARTTLLSSANAAAPISTASGTAAARAEKPADIKQSDAKKDSPAKNGKNFRNLAGFTPEREAAALTFVRSNHPELADLLERLKVRQPPEYQKAVRDLFRVSERLAVSREEFPLRYELELKQWILTSRIQVVTARLSMDHTPAQEEELKQLLAEQLEAHRELISFHLERATARAATLSRELQELETQKQSLLDAKFEKAMKSAKQKSAGKQLAGDRNVGEKSRKSEAKSDK